MMAVKKMIIYELMVRLFGNTCKKNIMSGSIEQNGVGKFNDITDKALFEIKKMGFSHVWYMGTLEHASMSNYSNQGIPMYPSQIVKGHAGSAYAVRDYYDVCPDLAVNVDRRIEEFENLIKRTHDSKLKTIIDFVPNHIARCYSSDKKPSDESDFGYNDDNTKRFSHFNEFYYLVGEKLCLGDTIKNIGKKSDTSYSENPARVTGDDHFHHVVDSNNWYDTIKLNYGIDYFSNRIKNFDPIPSVWLKMKDILSYWVNKGVDGFRCDMVHMVPLEFWKWVIPQIKTINEQIVFIGEIYDTNLYRDYLNIGKFDYLYNKSDLYDTLRDVIVNSHSTKTITYCWQRYDDIKDNLLNFLENHDEVRVTSSFFAGSFLKYLPAFVVTSLLHRSALLIYYGQELGENGEFPYGYSYNDGRTSIYDYGCMPTYARWVNNYKFNDENLTEEEIFLRNYYQKILFICNNYDCIISGDLYDLQYCNTIDNSYPEDDIYSFLRHSSNDLLLIISNFRDKIYEFNLRIPKEAFDNMNFNIMIAKKWSFKELLADKTGFLDIEDKNHISVCIEIKPYQSLVYDLSENII